MYKYIHICTYIKYTYTYRNKYRIYSNLSVVLCISCIYTRFHLNMHAAVLNGRGRIRHSFLAYDCKKAICFKGRGRDLSL